MPLVAATRAKQDPNLLSLSQIKYFGACPYGVASRSCCATQGSVGDRVTPTWITRRDLISVMKKAKSGRKKRSVTCKSRRPRYAPRDYAGRSPISVLSAVGCELVACTSEWFVCTHAYPV